MLARQVQESTAEARRVTSHHHAAWHGRCWLWHQKQLEWPGWETSAKRQQRIGERVQTTQRRGQVAENREGTGARKNSRFEVGDLRQQSVFLLRLLLLLESLCGVGAAVAAARYAATGRYLESKISAESGFSIVTMLAL